MIVDRTGRKLKIGQLVEFPWSGMMQGKIVKIIERPIMINAKEGIAPQVVVVTERPHIVQGDRCNLYIVADPDPNDPIVKQMEEQEDKLKIIQ